MLKSSVQSKILETLPDDRPITAIQIVEDIEKCPRGFYPINKTHDQDSEADLGEKSIFKSSSGRYLCLSKTEGIPNFFLHEIIILHEKALPPKGFSLLNRTVDSQQRGWKKKQLCYKLVNQKDYKTAITDIIVCSKLKKAPAGFSFAGEINGVTICYKMGNTESTQNSMAPTIPPKPLSPIANSVYPSIGDTDDDYEILRPGPGYGPPAPGPVRPAPKPPVPFQSSFQHQNSIHTLAGSSYPGLEGIPFIVNPKFLNGGSRDNGIPKIRIKTIQQILREYDYSFSAERHLL
ncbi:multivesicular body subunit 12B [Euwallacea similis]|uniref:multivesicular body subunit 12B n=1 Tax=Euwallacea similis TaxID=1736056 RepID=UPI00344C3F3C